MSNEVKLTFAGDASKLEKTNATVTTSADQMADKVQASGGKMEKGWGTATSAAVFLTEGIANLGDGIQTITDLSRDSEIRADRLARAQNDVAQAAFDVEQAMRDSAQALLDWQQAGRDTAQAAIDVDQALLDAEAAQLDYNAAVKEFGKNSIEAKQALIDQRQANEDLSQAQLDAQQAEADRQQYLLDGKQATLDVTAATLDMNEARREAIPQSDLQVWTERLSSLAPILFAVIGVVQLFTATTWSLNFAWLASPLTWVIIGILALIAAIVWVATKTTWFQDAWNAAMGWITKTAKAVGDWFSGPFVDYFKKVWDYIGNLTTGFIDGFKSIPGRIKDSFLGLVEILSWPFRTAFNFVSDAWNNTVGKLSWTVPSWVPIVGGNTISAPKLPKFHDGIDRVPGLAGREMLAVLEAGEQVISADQAISTRGGGDTYHINVTVPLEDLKQLSTLEEFLEWLEWLRNNGRRGVVVA